ncbi:MAG: hypothetical protein QXE38_04040 [Candidatus Methanomethylicia archaeon]
MEAEKKPRAIITTLLIIGSSLTIFNGILIAIYGAPIVIASYPASSIEEVWVTPYAKNPPWARIVYGIPSLTEGGLVYFWLFVAFLQAILAAYISIRTRKAARKLSLWNIIISLFTIPIGGGFYIGLILFVIASLYGLEYPKKFEDTFIGKILDALRFRFFKKRTADQDLQKAALSIIFISLLSGLGSCLYAYNVFKIYQTGDSSAPSLLEAQNILIRGELYSEPIVYISALSNVAIMIIKWLLLTLCVYFFAFKIVGKEVTFSSLSNLLCYIYTPEIILAFMPLIFTNEPNLSQTWSLIFIPISWPLMLFYASRLWSFVLLVYAISKVQDVTLGRAIGRSLFAITPYMIITYLWIYPALNAPGFYLTFTGELLVLPLVLSLMVTIAFIFGALKRD